MGFAEFIFILFVKFVVCPEDVIGWMVLFEVFQFWSGFVLEFEEYVFYLVDVISDVLVFYAVFLKFLV